MTLLTCPCCGQPLREADGRFSLVEVDLDRNVIRRGLRQTKRLRPQQAEMISVLADAYPRGVTVDALVTRLYGQGKEPECPGDGIKSNICLMRPALASIGLAVECVRGHPSRYLLVNIEGDNSGAIAV